ncbi:hypothetical protein IFM47457_00357 [Aspergillus lentulus]|nr:hypothetical protein IFM47457_00357 [Aspergillus lentulus]
MDSAASSWTIAVVNEKLAWFDIEAAVHKTYQYISQRAIGISEDESVVAPPYSHRSFRHL